MKKGKIAIIGACLAVLLGGGAFGTSYYLAGSNKATSTTKSSNVESNQVNTTKNESNNSKEISNLNNEGSNDTSKVINQKNENKEVSSQSTTSNKTNKQSSNTTQQVSKTETTNNNGNTNTNDLGVTAYMNNVYSKVYLMKNPSYGGQALGEIYSGQIFSYIKTVGDWAYIRIGYVYGYIPVECVSFTKPSNVSNSMDNTNSRTYINQQGWLDYLLPASIRIYSEPSYNSNIISYLHTGTEVDVCYRVDGFARIMYGNKFGYVNMEFISFINPNDLAGSIPGFQSLNLTGTPVGSYANIYYRMSDDSMAEFKFSHNQPMNIVGETGNYYVIHVVDNIYAFAYKSDVEIN